MKSAIISKELNRFLISLLFVIPIGMLINNWLLAFGIVVFLYVIWLYYKIFQISNWLESGLKPENMPFGGGVWERLSYHINQTNKKSKNSKEKSNTLLKHFQGIVRGIPFATVVLNNNNEIEWANKMSSKLLKIKPELDIGRRIDNLFRDTKLSAMLAEPSEKEVEIVSPYNTTLVLSFRLLPFQAKSKLLIVRDISERFRLMERQKSFVEKASHELKTPLTSIYGYLDIMRTSKNIKANEKEMLEESFERAQSMVSLIEDLLFLSKLEDESSLQNLFEAVAMESLIKTSIKNNSNIDISIEKDLHVKAIKVEMHSLVSNIIQNAIKHNPDGTKIEIKWYSDKYKRANLEVRDYGQPIPKEHLDQLTEKFYRVSTSSSNSSGSGLGLSIVKSIVKRHDAKMKIISKKDYGTALKIQFPKDKTILNKE